MFIFRHHRNGESLHTFKYNMVIWIVMWYTIGQPGLAEASLRGMVRLAGNTHFPLSFVTRITFDCLRRCLCITLCRFWFSPEHPVFQPRVFSVKMSDFPKGNPRNSGEEITQVGCFREFGYFHWWRTCQRWFRFGWHPFERLRNQI